MAEKDFRILEDYVLPPKAPPPTEDFYKYVKPTQEEMDAKLEYDMDEEDFAWLEFFNEQRSKANLSPVSFDAFENLMDHFEKDCFFHCTSKNFKPIPPELEHQADCAVCLDGTSNEDNAILFCDMCSLSVHQKCYGVIRVPEEIWLCKRCLHSPAATANCCLCSCKSGALKRSLDGKWAHVVCAYWIPEACFGNDRAREPVMGIEVIPSMRWKLTCFICNQKGKGACLQCQHSNCSTAYHATCAQLVGLTMKMEMFVDADGVSKKKVTTFCEIHSNLANDSCPNNDLREFVGPKYPSSDDSENEVTEKNNSMTIHSGLQDSTKSRKMISWKSKLKFARKVLGAWMEMEQPIFVPVVTVATINKITRRARELEVEKHEAFVTRFHSYWTLKRQSRDGYPLLISRRFGENIRILNVNVHLSPGSSQHHSANPKSSNSAANTSAVSSSVSSPSEVFAACRSADVACRSADVACRSADVETGSDVDKVFCRESSELQTNDDDGDEAFALHLMFCQRLRQDLEKVRLLIELVRKRERLKSKQIKLHEKQVAYRLCPKYDAIKGIFEKLKETTMGTSHKSEEWTKFMDSIQVKLEGLVYFSADEFFSDLKHLVRLCPSSLAEEVTRMINIAIPLNIPTHTSDDSSHQIQGGVQSREPKPIFIRMNDPRNVISDPPPPTSKSLSRRNLDCVSGRVKAKKRKTTSEDVEASVAGSLQQRDKLLMDPVVSLTSMATLSDVRATNVECGRGRKQRSAVVKEASDEMIAYGRHDANENFSKEKESFKNYRMTLSPNTDDDDNSNEDTEKRSRETKAKKAKLSSSESESCQVDDDDSSEDEGIVHDFKPFDLVWAKYHSFPWYPAMILSVNSPPPPSLSIQLPVVAQETVDMLTSKPLLRLVLFFDEKMTRKCIPVNKLLPLGTNPAIDKWKLLDSKKINTRKIIQAAYDKALQYQQAEMPLDAADRDSKPEGSSRNESPRRGRSQSTSHEEQHRYQMDLQQLQHQLSQQIISESTYCLDSASEAPLTTNPTCRRNHLPPASSDTRQSTETSPLVTINNTLLASNES